MRHYIGWNPQISPDGRYVAAGFGGGFVLDRHRIDERGELHRTPLSSRAFVSGWLDAVRLVIVDDAIGAVQVLTAPEFAPVNLFQAPLAGGYNWHGAGGGVFAGSFTNTRTGQSVLDINNIRIHEKGAQGVSVDRWGHVWSAVNGKLTRYTNGRPTLSVAKWPNAWRAGANGAAGFGYYGPSHVVLPDGRIHDVTVTPWREEGVPFPFLHGGQLWLATGSGEAIYIRPFNEKAVITIPVPSVHVDVVSVGDVLVVTSNDDKGRMILEEVSALSPRAAIPPRPVTPPSPPKPEPPKPEPEPQEPRMPEPTAPPPLGSIEFLKPFPASAGNDIRSFRETSRITRVEFTDDSTSVFHTKLGQWPTVGKEQDDEGLGIEANIVVVAFLERAYGAPADFLRPGKPTMHIGASKIGPITKVKELKSWRPKTGETVGLMVTTPCRDEKRSTNERTNLVLAKWGVNQTFGQPPLPPAPEPEPEPPDEPTEPEPPTVPCTLEASGSERDVRVPAAGAAFTVRIAASGPDCPWVLTASEPFISISRSSGRGSAESVVTVQPNAGGVRSGEWVVADPATGRQALRTVVTQEAPPPPPKSKPWWQTLLERLFGRA